MVLDFTYQPVLLGIVVHDYTRYVTDGDRVLQPDMVDVGGLDPYSSSPVDRTLMAIPRTDLRGMYSINLRKLLLN